MTNYPDEIYCNDYNIGEILAAERAYDICKKNAQEANIETEWFNLTEQIAAGANIDWKKLDGVPAKCVHESGAVYQHKLVRNKEHYIAPVVMLEDYYPKGWGIVFVNAWFGDDDWTLYIDRPVPLKRKTADQLEPGVCFKGREVIDGEEYIFDRAQIIQRANDSEPVMVSYDQNLRTQSLHFEPCMVDVLEEYGIGTFKAADDEA